MFFIYFLLDYTNVFRVYVRYCLWRGRLGQGLETLSLEITDVFFLLSARHQQTTSKSFFRLITY